MRPTRTSTRGSERGAVAVFTAGILVVVLVVAGFAVDLGMQRVVRSDMQAVADVTALDAARLLDGRNAKQITDGDPTHPSLASTLSTSFARNRSSLGTAQTPTARLVMTTTDTTTGAVTASRVAGDTEIPDAVEVNASGSVDFAFGGITGVKSGGATRTALAEAHPSACFALGSYAAAVKTGNSALLGPILGVLGSGIDLTAASYQGLATTQLSLVGLQTALGAGTTAQLLGTSITLANFYLVVANALTAQGDTADAAVVNALRIHLGALAAGTMVHLADLLSLDTSQGDGKALGLSLNALDLIMGGATIANGSSFVGVPGLSINLAGLTSASTSLKVVEPAQAGCGTVGHATADNAQVRLKITASVLQALPNILGLVGVSAGPISIDAQAAKATGSLTQITCPTAMKVNVVNQLAPITITVPITLSVVLLGTMNLTATITTVPTNPAASTVTLQVPGNITTPVTTTNGNLNIGSASVTTSPTGSTGLLGLIGFTLSDVVNALNGLILQPLLTGLVTPLLSTVSSLLDTLLGVTLAGSDAFAQSATCGSPSLVG